MQNSNKNFSYLVWDMGIVLFLKRLHQNADELVLIHAAVFQKQCQGFHGAEALTCFKV